MFALFRVAPERSPGGHLAATFAQIVVMWGTALGLVPFLFRSLEVWQGLPALQFPGHAPAGAIILVVASAIGLITGCAMALNGRGTPLPTQCAARLVIAGPYAYIRNPMAVTGLAQGFGVAMLLGSPLTYLYVVAGFLVWNFLMRPAEERDLETRFGAEYRAYRDAVRCWIPRTTPYRPAPWPARACPASSR